MKVQNIPIKNQGYCISNCCNSMVNVIPACLGDPEMYLCKTCKELCDTEVKPLYIEKSKGVYSKIKYNGQ